MYILVFMTLLSTIYSFNIHTCRTRQATKLHENFKPDDMTVVSDPLIFSEKQLREYTATYSVDERMNPLEAITGLFSGLFSGNDDASSSDATPSYYSMISKKVSVELLEERIALYVEGKINAKQFSSTLKAAFKDKLPQAMPAVKAGLPAAKASALDKML